MSDRNGTKISKGFVAPIALWGMILGLSIAYYPPCHTVVPFSLARSAGLLLFRSDWGIKLVMNLGVAAHIVEASYVLWKGISQGLRPQDTMGWFTLALLIGFPAIQEMGKGHRTKNQSRRH